MIPAALRLLACILACACAWRCACLMTTRLAFAAPRHGQLDVEDILRDKSLCFLVFCAAALVISFATTPWMLVAGMPTAYLLTRTAPAMLDARAARELRSACDEQVDVMADIVAMGIRSGLSFDAALDLYCDKFDNVLAHQLAGARLEWSSGLASRQQALESLFARTKSRALKRFADTSIQAIHYGSPLADMLARFSCDVRRQRRGAIERRIAKTPVKLLVPTGTCILPAMLILVMGPVLLQFVQTGF